MDDRPSTVVTRLRVVELCDDRWWDRGEKKNDRQRDAKAARSAQ